MTDEQEVIWTCTIGTKRSDVLPNGADSPMRIAVEWAFFNVTGRVPDYLFSGWGAKLTEGQRAVVENREPKYDNGLPEPPAGYCWRLMLLPEIPMSPPTVYASGGELKSEGFVSVNSKGFVSKVKEEI